MVIFHPLFWNTIRLLRFSDFARQIGNGRIIEEVNRKNCRSSTEFYSIFKTNKQSSRLLMLKWKLLKVKTPNKKKRENLT